MELQVLGKEKIGKYEFTGIEGGFGKDKKSMTAKDIANLHNQPLGKINELINRNINRFKDGVDILDLKTVIPQKDIEIFGFTQNAWNRMKNAFLVSERGYMKLLRLLEDDIAWNIYDELVDNYFNMRQSIKKPLTAVEQIKLLPKAVVELDDRVTNLEENQVIPQPLYNTLQHRISQRVSEIAFSYGGVNKKQRSELFKDINGGVKRIANVSARSMLREKHYQMVMDFVNAWEPSTATRTIIQQTALNVGEPA